MSFLTIKVKLNTTKEQFELLQEVLTMSNAACNVISKIAYKNKKFRQFDLHHLSYYTIRESTSLPANYVIRAIAKVTDSYKRSKRSKTTFKEHGAIELDKRLLSINAPQQIAKITTCSKRIAIPYLCSKQQFELLCQAFIKQSKLLFKNKAFYLQLCVEIQDEKLLTPTGVLGVDFGICNIATTNTGEIFSGKLLTRQRKWYKKQRASLQQKRTRAAKRKLRKISGKETRFVRNTNHIISKALVRQALQQQKALAIEDLKGIRKRRENSFVDTGLHSWAFHQLRLYIEYKAKLYTVPLVIVNPKYTSQECNICGYIHKENRKSQSEFLCQQCGHFEHADINAAKNIGKRAALSIGLLSSDSDTKYQSRLKDKLTALAVSY